MTNPVALATSVWGNGERRALLLHGLTSAGSTWWRTGEALADLGFTVVAPDLRGHGSSPRGDSLSLEAYRDDVLLLGDGWDLLVGHSLGGAIAALVMAAAPRFADSVVLEDPAMDSDITTEFISQSPEPLANPTVAAVAAEHPTWHPRDVEFKVQALLASGPHISQETIEDAAPWDVWPAIESMSVPVLVLAADLEFGSLVSPQRAAAIADAERMTCLRMTGAGHSLHRDAFEEYFERIREFVGE